MVQIRRKQEAAPVFIPDFGDPLGLLVHCHRKIEAQLEVLERAAGILRHGDSQAIDTALAAVAGALAHFAGPGVKHTADEEESLFPRLRRYAGSSEREVLAARDELEAPHQIAEKAHADLDALAQGLRAGQDLDEFEACLEALVSLYGPHIVLENEVVFPAAARTIPPDELLAVGGEMRARRAGMLGGNPHAGR
jgi:pyridoxamine 5'-phosphate oxidase